MGNYKLYKKHFSEYEGLKSKIITKGNNLRYKFGKQLITFLFFTLLSGILWLFHSMGKTYIAPVFYEVHYTNLPTNKVIASDLPDHITLIVNSTGYKIIQERIYSKFNRLKLNVSSFMPYIVNSEVQSYYVFRSFDKKKIEEQLNNRIEIIDISPDTLGFKFANAITRKVPVNPILKLEFAKQIMQRNKAVVKPDSIQVSGPNSIIDTLQYVNTELMIIKNISGSISKSAKLEKIKYLNYPFDEVTISIDAERFTEANLKIPVTVINLPDSINIRLFPNNIDVSFYVCLSDYKKLSPEQFRFVVDYNETLRLNQTQLDVMLDKAPDFINTIRYKQKTIEFIIEK